MHRPEKRYPAPIVCCLIVVVGSLVPIARSTPAVPSGPETRPVARGPEHGALVIVGGGRVGSDILSRFFELAGGKDAPLVVIPTAAGAATYQPDWSGLKMFKDFGATNITLLHTVNRTVAESVEFV